MEVYRDCARGLEERVGDLLSRLTLEEKLTQLGGVWSFELVEGEGFSPAKAAARIPLGIGHLCRVGVGTGFDPAAIAAFCNDLQRYLREHTRLGIPALVHEECLSGYTARGAAIFPQAIGLASTWEPELPERMTAAIREQMRATGVHQGLAPVLDVCRDGRWGRVEETFGEDPYLVSRMGVAYVRGLEGPEPRSGVVATLKHFAGHGASEAGMNWAPAPIPPRELREVHLPPFAAAIREARARAVMSAYHEMDGVPASASAELLTAILREEWGFEGMVIADYYAVDMLHAYHRVAADKAAAARLAITAGLDVELPVLDAYGEPLRRLVVEGKVPMAVVDRAVSRVLRLKFQLGLFEQPFVDPPDPALFDGPAHRALALELARKSLVLLRNEGGRLPLAREARVAVIGPAAADGRLLLGDYSYPAQAEMVGPASGRTVPTSSVHVVDVLEGMRGLSRGEIRFAQGCQVLGEDRSGFAEAVRAARGADVAVVVAGGRSGLTLDCTCGEMRDRAELGLPGVQEELVRAVAETGTPVVLVLVNGRPYALESIARVVPAILEAWLPGEEGGRAVAEALYGQYNPGGKLPIGFPRRVGQIPVYYRRKPSGGRSQFWGDYVDSPAGPLFPFGHGLSYTRFAYSDLKVQPAVVAREDTVTVTVRLTCVGPVSGEEVVQLYLRDEVASVTRPVQELKGFCRVHLAPGESREVTFTVDGGSLAFLGPDLRPLLEPGTYRVMVGGSSAAATLEGVFELV